MTCVELSAQQQPRLRHRWEVEPSLGASWIQVSPASPNILEPSNFVSSKRRVRMEESRKAIEHTQETDPSIRESSLKNILSQLEKNDENRIVQLRMVSAAIALADSSHSSILWERVRDDAKLRLLLEPALVKWKSPLALDLWRARLTQSDISLSELTIAIEGIVALDSTQDLPALEYLLRSDRTSTSLKVIAARAMGALSKENLDSMAEQISLAAIEQHELIIAELLSQHSSDRARKLLVQVMKSDNSMACSVAYLAIARNFKELARELAPTLLLHTDNNLRLQAIEVLNRFDDVESLKLQAKAISDHNLKIRNKVRDNLAEKARIAELKPVVDEVIDLQLDSNSAQSITQSILLGSMLRERERCPKLVKLLDHTNSDVSITAAWALQVLVDSPELLELIFQKTELITERLKKQDEVTPTEILKQAYLFEALGRNRYRPALESLKSYVPKKDHKMGDVARASAIWAIGKILEGSQDSSLSKQLVQRSLDQTGDDPEDPLVQFASTVALGWLKAPESNDDLRKVTAKPQTPLAMAKDWALKQISP